MERVANTIIWSLPERAGCAVTVSSKPDRMESWTLHPLLRHRIYNNRYRLSRDLANRSLIKFCPNSPLKELRHTLHTPRHNPEFRLYNAKT